MIYGVDDSSVPEHREDVQIMTERGQSCEEYCELIRFERSGEDVKDTASNHLVQAVAGLVNEMGVEETAKGPILIVSGNRIYIPRGKEKDVGASSLYSSW